MASFGRFVAVPLSLAGGGLVKGSAAELTRRGGFLDTWAVREILGDLDRWRERGEDVALATLVAVHGSAPRPAGARLAVTRGGGMAGSVSGGCVETDVFAHAMQVLDRREPVVVTYGIADDVAFAVGLSCGGSIDVLVEPFSAADPAWAAVRAAVEHERPAALAVALEPAGLRGRKLGVLGDGSAGGAIDPAIDAQVVAEARRMLPQGGTRIVRMGAAAVFLEAFAPPLRLFIVGATHAATALCRMAKPLGFHVTIIDPRSVFATAERFPEADEIILAPPGDVLAGVRLDAWSYLAVLTHDPKFDLPALRCALRSGARYIGAMGSRRTHARRRELLVDEGFTEADLARVRAPIGLDLGGRVPEETALAILAEMIAVRHDRPGGALSARTGGIHGRE